MVQNKRSTITCQKINMTEIIDLLKCLIDNQVTVSIIGSDVTQVIYMMQLPDSMETYLTLKFPNIILKPLSFVAGKI